MTSVLLTIHSSKHRLRDPLDSPASRNNGQWRVSWCGAGLSIDRTLQFRRALLKIHLAIDDPRALAFQRSLLLLEPRRETRERAVAAHHPMTRHVRGVGVLVH